MCLLIGFKKAVYLSYQHFFFKLEDIKEIIVRIPPELFMFLSELKENNNRPWFQENKGRYEEYLKEPLLAFITAFAERLPEVSPYYMAVPRIIGGSLFRIYRDVRFSKDKRPYKTWAGMHFRHERARDVHSPGYYIHLEPGNTFISCGIWKPDRESLERIRQIIFEHPQRWLDAIGEKRFNSTYLLAGDALKRPPRGFDPDHPLIEDLKRKDYLASIQIADTVTTRESFLDYYVEMCQAAAPFMRFLTESLGLSW
jgi:uncharacterized protein (TIGR02453 family)